MAKLPIDSRTKTEKLIEDHEIIPERRGYLGMSSLGNKCARSLWYSFRLCSQQNISAKLNRLFQRGHREEAIIQEDLRRIGIIHHSDQLEVTDGNGHIKGHIDDILERVPDAPKTPHLGEYKTHNDKSFSDLKKKGMIESKPVHHAQMLCYMHKLGLKRGLYIAVNKNTDERYYERVAEDPEKAEYFLVRGRRIISSESPPPRIGGSTWFECKFCNHYLVCHFGEKPQKNCRTCQHCDIHDEGIWKCSGYKLVLAFDQQQLGCDKYKMLNTLEG